MLRKQIRLRKEYLFEKNAEKNQVNNTNKDCEYNEEFYQDPRVLVTTSRNPSARLKKFHKEISSLIPNSITVNRGAYKIKDINDFGTRKGFSDIVIIHENRGEPNGLIVSHLPIGPTIYFGLSNVIMRHDIKGRKDNISLAYPNLIFHNFNDKIGERIKTILQRLFPVPLNQKSKRVISFIAQNDFISLRHHVYDKPSYNKVDLMEVGPRFEMRPFMIRLGNLMDTNSTIEWSIKSHINTAVKNKQISLN